MHSLPLTRRTLAAAIGASALLPRVAIGQSDPRPSITIAVQQIANSNALEVLREQSNVGTRVLTMVYDGLINPNLRGQLEPTPALAVSWRRASDRVLEATLREGVRFHNGDLLTAEDVVFSFGPERMFGSGTPSAPASGTLFSTVGGTVGSKALPPEVAAVARRAFPTLDKVEAIDARTVRFTTTVPDVTLEGRLASSTGWIVSRRAFEAAASWPDWSRAPVSTGAYKVVEFKPDQSLTLAAHDQYWGGRPPLREIRFVVVPEVPSRIAGLLSGQYDFACDVPPDQIEVIERNERFEVQGGTITNHRITVFDRTHPLLVDPRIRRGFAHAVDRKLIVDSLWGGRTEIPRGLQFPFYGSMHIEDWQNPVFDPVEARRLVQASGYKGEPIPYRLLNNYYTNQVATAQILIEMWREVGLNVVIEMRENFPQVFARTGPRAVRDWSSGASFSDPVGGMISSFGPRGQSQQVGEGKNEELNRLCEAVEGSTDMDARRRMWRRILEIAEVEDPHYVVLHQTANFTGKRRGVAWKASPSFAMDFRPGNWA